MLSIPFYQENKAYLYYLQSFTVNVITSHSIIIQVQIKSNDQNRRTLGRRIEEYWVGIIKKTSATQIVAQRNPSAICFHVISYYGQSCCFTLETLFTSFNFLSNSIEKFNSLKQTCFSLTIYLSVFSLSPPLLIWHTIPILHQTPQK